MVGQNLKIERDIEGEEAMKVLFGEEIGGVEEDRFDGSNEEFEVFKSVFHRTGVDGTSASFGGSAINNLLADVGQHTKLLAYLSYQTSLPTSSTAMQSSSKKGFQLATQQRSGFDCFLGSSSSFAGSDAHNLNAKRKISPSNEHFNHDNKMAKYFLCDTGSHSVQLMPSNDVLGKSAQNSSEACQHASFHVVESFDQRILSSYHLINGHSEMGSIVDIEDGDDLHEKCEKQQLEDGKISLEDKPVTSPPSQESFASEILATPAFAAPKETTGELICIDQSPRECRIVKSSTIESKRALTRDLPNRLSSQAHRLLLDARWKIEPRKRSDRDKLSWSFVVPDGGISFRGLSQAWKQCGEWLLADGSSSEKDENGREWTDIDVFWSDFSDTLLYIEESQQLSLLERWQILDPFMAVVWIDKRLRVLREGKTLRAVRSTTSCPRERKKATSADEGVHPSDGQISKPNPSLFDEPNQNTLPALLEGVRKRKYQKSDRKLCCCSEIRKRSLKSLARRIGKGVYSTKCLPCRKALTSKLDQKKSPFICPDSNICESEVAEDHNLAENVADFGVSKSQLEQTSAGKPENSPAKKTHKRSKKISEIGENESDDKDRKVNQSPCMDDRINDHLDVKGQSSNVVNALETEEARASTISSSISMEKKPLKSAKAKNSEIQLENRQKRPRGFRINDDDLLITAIIKNKNLGFGAKSFSSKLGASQSKALRKLKGRKGNCRLTLRTPGKSGNHSVDGKRFVLETKTVLCWMIEMGILSIKEIIQYRNPKSNEVLKDGWVTRDGILCNCCTTVLSLFDFKAHSGFKLQKPCLNLFLQSGKPFALCQFEAWSAEYKSRKGNIRVSEVEEVDQNDDTCGLCGDGGELICCDNCPSTYHQACLPSQELPEGSWYCNYCICQICDSAVNQTEASSSMAMLDCSQCGYKYHDTCIKEKATCNAEGASGTYFCGESCQEVYLGLRSRVGVAINIVDGFSWNIIRCNHDDQKIRSAQKIAALAECNTKLAVALSIMEECFLPMVDPKTGIDMIPQCLYNWGSNFARLNYEGFYTAVLEKGDEVVSVASIRVHGITLAEMPLIATSSGHRRQGMCRRLLNEVEKVLKSLKVKLLVLSAIPELVDTWTSGFGFKTIEDDNKQQLKKFNLMLFPGTSMLIKNLCSTTAQGSGGNNDLYAREIQAKNLLRGPEEKSVSEISVLTASHSEHDDNKNLETFSVQIRTPSDNETMDQSSDVCTLVSSKNPASNDVSSNRILDTVRDTKENPAKGINVISKDRVLETRASDETIEILVPKEETIEILVPKEETISGIQQDVA